MKSSVTSNGSEISSSRGVARADRTLDPEERGKT